MVELPGFQTMVARFNPRYQLPSRSFFSRTPIPALYCQVREDIEKKLLQHSAFYSVTTDMWASGSTELYINCDWDMCSHCLTTTCLIEDHTGENIKMSLLNSLHEWNLDATKLELILVLI